VPESQNDTVANLTPLGNELYFTAELEENSSSLLRYNVQSQTLKTILIQAITSNGLSINHLTVLNDKLYFTATSFGIENNQSQQIFQYDPLSFSYKSITNIESSTLDSENSPFSQLTVVNKKLFFKFTPTPNQYNLLGKIWTYDPTLAESRELTDFVIDDLLVFQNKLYFTDTIKGKFGCFDAIIIEFCQQEVDLPNGYTYYEDYFYDVSNFHSNFF